MSTSLEYLKNTLRRSKEKYDSEGLVYMIRKIPITISHFIDNVMIDIRSKFSEYSTKEVEYAHKPRKKLEKFTKDNEASQLLYDLITEHSASQDVSSSTVLEIGCNAGRRANHLYRNGISDIYGVDINREAIDLMEESFPELFATITTEIGPAQEVLSTFEDGKFDIVYTVSVLMHIRSNEQELFNEISRVCDDLLITMESENSDFIMDEIGLDDRPAEWHSHRNYRGEFEPRGFT